MKALLAKSSKKHLNYLNNYLETIVANNHLKSSANHIVTYSIQMGY
nr:MAG TPA: hypothetical protein [Bacteriophage sp.]